MKIKCANPDCNNFFTPERKNQKYCCHMCQVNDNHRKSNERSKQKRQDRHIVKHHSISETCALARQAGMSYGQYVAQRWGYSDLQ